MAFEFRSFATLLGKETRRFAKVWLQTVLSPLVTTSLYFLIFGVALGARLATVGGVPYVTFVVPGLVTLAVINAAFLNTSSSLFQSKINGTTVDLLVAPLGAAEIVSAFVGAAVFRSLIMGALVLAVALAFTDVAVASWLVTLGMAAGVAATFAAFGIATAIWAEKFDHLAAVPNFVLTPLTFLGGVFYTADMLPAPWNTVSRLNPIYYMVNGLRHGLLGHAEVPLGHAAAVVGAVWVVATVAAAVIVRSGYKLRA